MRTARIRRRETRLYRCGKPVEKTGEMFVVPGRFAVKMLGKPLGETLGKTWGERPDRRRKNRRQMPSIIPVYGQNAAFVRL
jgi:hypothetical protein